ncbi:hypothetical protein [Streptomyces sp. NPDC060001]|uniref:hypothetical protein n=1 Tax=Streptomyces sp. NPDC060001 TaxID=3347032 RepID=UPI0036B6E669
MTQLALAALLAGSAGWIWGHHTARITHRPVGASATAREDALAIQLADANTAIERVRAVRKSPARSPFNTRTNAEDDGWDQALDAVHAALDQHDRNLRDSA